MKTFVKFAVVVAACALMAPVLMPRHAQAMPNRYSDRQIFEGLVLGHGPVASLIPQTGGNHAWSARESSAASSLEARIAKRQPSFIAAFARDARSGDPQAIENAMARATKLVAVSRGSVDQAIGNIGVAVVDSQDYAIEIDPYWGVMTVDRPQFNRTTAFGREAFARSVASVLR